jgi:hypothetical protein
MKRTALIYMTVCLAALACAEVSTARAGEESCSREDLVKITDKYFESIQKHGLSAIFMQSTLRCAASSRNLGEKKQNKTRKASQRFGP